MATDLLLFTSADAVLVTVVVFPTPPLSEAYITDLPIVLSMFGNTMYVQCKYVYVFTLNLRCIVEVVFPLSIHCIYCFVFTW